MQSHHVVKIRPRKNKTKKPKYLQNPNQMDTKTSVAETKAFPLEAENTPKKRNEKRQKEKERKQNSVTQRRNGTKKTKKSFAAR
jgi:hypothetical protein